MEGPTPSSAVYYGSLSIHAGCFLLLRSGPLLEQATAARVLAGALGAATAIFAGITTRVQSDVKSSLAYASLTQVGIIVVEIAIGWYTIAFVHLAGHACFRLLQFLSAPNVLHDLHGMENAIGNRPVPAGGSLGAGFFPPIPVRGPIVFSPTLTITGEYNDNILLDNNRRESDFVIGVTPGARTVVAQRA
jgi:NAD(P)H-quinone oxidoreductase subunit 5